MTDAIHGNLRQSAYEAIRALIVTGQLSPGARVTEQDIVDQLGISRTPVREALNRLHRDGLVVERPRTGFAVVNFDEKMLCDVFDLREELDAYATRLAVARITPEALKDLQQKLDACDAAARLDLSPRGRLTEMEIGMEIHLSVARSSGNLLLAQTMEALLIKCQVFVWMELTQLDEWQAARDDHRAIVAAIAARDADLAVERSRRHIRASRDGILSLLTFRKDLRASYGKKP